MRKSHLALAGLGLTAAAVTGSAFTAANPFTASTNVAGYGQMTATGATVTNVAYTLAGGDASKISAVTFTTSTDINGKTARLLLKQGSTIVGTFSCDTSGAHSAGSMTVPCAVTTPADLSSFDTTGFTVVQ
jgi:hypothetical protein